jgi:hypothetical protein
MPASAQAITPTPAHHEHHDHHVGFADIDTEAGNVLDHPEHAQGVPDVSTTAAAAKLALGVLHRQAATPDGNQRLPRALCIARPDGC